MSCTLLLEPPLPRLPSLQTAALLQAASAPAWLPSLPPTHSALVLKYRNIAGKSPCSADDWALQMYSPYFQNALKTAKWLYFLAELMFPFSKMTSSCFSISRQISNSLSPPRAHLGTLLPAPHRGLWRTSRSPHHELASPIPLSFAFPSHGRPVLPSSPLGGDYTSSHLSTSPSLLDLPFTVLPTPRLPTSSSGHSFVALLGSNDLCRFIYNLWHLMLTSFPFTL